MGLPITVTKTLAAASVNNIALSQTPSGAGNLTLNGSTVTGGVATLDTARRVLFTFAANEAARTFVVYGTNEYGNAQQENVTGTASTAVTLKDYKTVTRISVDAATAGALTVGTNGVGASAWLSVSRSMTPSNISASVVVTGTVNYTVQYTYDPDPFGFTPNPSGPVATTFNHPLLTAQTATAEGTFTYPVTAIRLVVNSGTGSAALTLLQAGIAGP